MLVVSTAGSSIWLIVLATAATSEGLIVVTSASSASSIAIEAIVFVLRLAATLVTFTVATLLDVTLLLLVTASATAPATSAPTPASASPAIVLLTRLVTEGLIVSAHDVWDPLAASWSLS